MSSRQPRRLHAAASARRCLSNRPRLSSCSSPFSLSSPTSRLPALASPVPKRAYGAFDGTDLDERLCSLEVDEVVLAGQHTHICVRHTAYGALLRGYAITVASDAVCAFEGVDEEQALDYLRTVYGAEIASVAELTQAVAALHV